MKKRRYHTRRLYMGPPGAETSVYDTVRVSDAARSAVITGDLLHALKAMRGQTGGCAFARMARDPKNAGAFDHDVIDAFFTKTAAYLVDKRAKDGKYAHAVRYAHLYGWLTDANDTGELKALVKKDPAIMERSFTLSAPPKSKKLGSPHKGRSNSGGKSTGEGRGMTVSPRTSNEHAGALRRAVLAGRINKAAAEQLAAVASKAA